MPICIRYIFFYFEGKFSTFVLISRGKSHFRVVNEFLAQRKEQQMNAEFVFFGPGPALETYWFRNRDQDDLRMKSSVIGSTNQLGKRRGRLNIFCWTIRPDIASRIRRRSYLSFRRVHKRKEKCVLINLRSYHQFRRWPFTYIPNCGVCTNGPIISGINAMYI
jgi:hypothetical protein